MKKTPNHLYVYIIVNTVLNKQYIGSRVCYKNNIIDDLYWGSSKYLNEDYKIYGKENFTKTILQYDYVNIKDLLDGETEYILKYNTLAPNGYNRFLPNQRNGFHTNGVESPMKNKHHTKESKQKMSAGHKGKTFTEEHKKNLSISIKNSITIEEKLKRSERTKGDRNPMFGKVSSNRGIKLSNEAIELIRINTKIAMQRPEVKQKQKENKPLMFREKNGMWKKHHTKNSKEQISINIKNTPKIKCQYCYKEFYPWHYSRSHGDKCKYKIDIKI